MKQLEPWETYEEDLLSYAEMCYSVAFALTHNTEDARALAQEVLIWAWHLRGSMNSRKDIKKNLLIKLRKKFLKSHCQIPWDQQQSQACKDQLQGALPVYVMTPSE